MDLGAAGGRRSLMLYPIGAAAANAVFVLVKICMVAGLFILIFAEKQGGYCLWASASIGAVVMTIIKWHLAGGGSFLMGGSIFVDIFMPVLLLILMKREKSM